ncbi:MAG: hypothetical protein M0Z66_06310 [Thermaerobacter sp.]|nr:hypothetical protein [Thermaerobacter sp.]
MSRRTWARLFLDAAAGSWIVALSYAIPAALMHIVVPMWLPALAFIITAIGRRISQKVGMAALIVSCFGGALAGGLPAFAASSLVHIFLGLFAALAAAYVAQSLPRSAPYYALRQQFSIGMIVLLLVNIFRLIQGTPSAYTMVLPAAVLIAAGLFGLPYVHSLDALGEGQDVLAPARPGLRLGGLILLVSVGFGLLIEGIRLLYLGGAISALLSALFQAVSPLLSLIFSLFALFIPHTRLKAHPQKANTQVKVPPPKHFHVHPASPQFAFWLHFAVAAIFTLAIAGVIYYLYARQRRELEESGQVNAPGATEAVAFQRIGRLGRGRLDFGSGARGKVRAAVGRHVLHETVRPSETARRVAQREGWPEDALAAYERARYQLQVPFEEHHAAQFLQRFNEWRQARRRRS